MLPRIRSYAVIVYRRCDHFLKSNYRWLFGANATHVIAFSTVATMIATFSYVYYADQQWSAMVQQVSAAHAAIYQNRVLLRQAVRSADAAKSASDTAEKVLKASDKALQIDQRAYVVLDRVKIVRVTENTLGAKPGTEELHEFGPNNAFAATAAFRNLGNPQRLTSMDL